MKKIHLALLFGLVAAVCLSMARFDALCDDLRSHVFRLHIVANSDEPADQAVKLKVRDAILHQYGDLFSACPDEQTAISTANEHLSDFRQTAESVLRENGLTYDVGVSVGPAYFENREYDTFTLPAGTYSSLRVTLGKANGKNWWCVLFPAVCVSPSCRLDTAVNEDSATVAENSRNYKMAFKTVEWYEDLKKILEN